MNAICNLHRSRLILSALCLAAIAGLSGCASLAGHWTGDDLQPEMSRDQFKFLIPDNSNGKLVSADIRLQNDGSYTAELNYDGRIEQSVGTWAIDSNDYLTFVDEHGRSYGYSVRRVSGEKIGLVKSIKGTDAILTINRQS